MSTPAGVIITNLPQASALTGNEVYPAVQQGSTVQVSGSAINGCLVTAAETALGLTAANLILVFPEGDPRRYGVDFVNNTNSYHALQTMFNVAMQYNSYQILFPKSLGNVRCDQGLSWNATQVSVDFAGNTLDFSHMTTGSALAVSNTNAVTPTAFNITDPNQRVTYNHAHPIKNARFLGPGVGVTAVTALTLADAATPYQIGGIMFYNLSFENFAQDVYFGNGANFHTFIECLFTMTAGTDTTYSITWPVAPNDAGERCSFIGCTWANKSYLLNNLNGTFADGFFQNCSFDYFYQVFSITGGAGTFVFESCHFEANTDLANWGYLSGAGSIAILNKCTMSLTNSPGNTRTSYDIFWSDSTVTNGGLILRDCTWGVSGSVTWTTRLVGGTGVAKIEGLNQAYFQPKNTLAAGANKLAYGGFESASFNTAQTGFTPEWSVTGGAARSTAQAHTGTYSLVFAVTGSQNAGAVSFKPCKENQWAQGEFWYYASIIASGGFASYIQYLDEGGNALLTRQGVSFTTSTQPVTNVWTRVFFGTLQPAPAGTAYAQISFSFTGSSGVQNLYIDDVILNVA